MSPSNLTMTERGVTGRFRWNPGGITANPPSRTPCWQLVSVDDLVIDTDVSISDPGDMVEEGLRDWFSEWVDLRGKRRITVDGAVWDVRRQVAIAVGNRAPGEAIPMPPPAGLVFRAESGHRFYSGEFSAAEFFSLSHAELATMLNHGRTER